MDFNVKRVNVWAASISDEPGGLATTLKGLAEAGADLDFVIARRAPEKPGTGVVFLTPIRGDREIAAASLLGFNLTSSVASVRVSGKNVPGIAARITDVLGNAGLTVRGFSVAVIGSRFIAYVGFDSVEDADEAVELLRLKASLEVV
jgi:predicted amino acid-binding ACT domain protein